MTVSWAQTPESIRGVLREATYGLEHEAPAIAAEIARELHRAVPVLNDDPRAVSESARGSSQSIMAFLSVVRSGEPLDVAPAAPQSIRTARALARGGEGMRHLLRMCHLGHGVFLAAWERHLAALDLPVEQRLAAAAAAAQVTFAWVDGFTEQLTDAYEDEREQLARTGEAQRVRAIRSVLAGEVHDQDAMSRTLRYDLRRVHTAVVLWSPAEDGDAAELLDRGTRRLAARLGATSPLSLSVSSSVLWAWLATDATPTSAALAGLQLDAPVSIAVGEPASGASGFRASHRDASDAFRVALLSSRAPGSTTLFSQVHVAAMLADDLERTRRFVRSELKALATDDEHHARLRETLRIYLEQSGSRQTTATRLGVHANTVGNRIGACQELLGDDLGGRPGELHLALTLADQLGPSAFTAAPDSEARAGAYTKRHT